MEHHISIFCDDVELTASLHYPTSQNSQEQLSRYPIVIICHGFLGNRIGVDRLFVQAGRKFASQGYMVLRFDYGGCGESTGDYGSGGLDILITQTMRVIDYALSLDCVDLNNVTLLGHSLGGAVAVLTAARDHRVKNLILWSAVAYPHNDLVRIVGLDAYKKLLPDSAIEHSSCSFTASFFDSLSKHQPLEQTRRFSGDVYLIHGTADDVIPVDYAPLYQKMFWGRENGHCELDLIFQGDHTFSTKNIRDQLLDKTANWLSKLGSRNEEWNHWNI
jgi:uncharacterized protein